MAAAELRYRMQTTLTAGHTALDQLRGRDSDSLEDQIQLLHGLFNDLNGVMLEALDKLSSAEHRSQSPAPPLVHSNPPEPEPQEKDECEERVATVETQVETVKSKIYTKKVMETCKWRRMHHHSVERCAKFESLSHQLAVDLAKVLHGTGLWKLLAETPASGESDVSDALDPLPATLMPSNKGLTHVYHVLMTWLRLHQESKLGKSTQKVLKEFAKIQSSGETRSFTEEAVGLSGGLFLCKRCRCDGRETQYNAEAKALVPRAPALNAPKVLPGLGSGRANVERTAPDDKPSGASTARVPAKPVVPSLDLQGNPPNYHHHRRDVVPWKRGKRVQLPALDLKTRQTQPLDDSESRKELPMIVPSSVPGLPTHGFGSNGTGGTGYHWTSAHRQLEK